MTAATLPLTTGRAIALAHPDGGRVVSQINHWLASSGKEWTVKRLKAIRVACLQLRAGNHSLVKQIYQENSISYTKDDLLPRGPFRGVVRDYSQAQRPIVLRRLDLILRSYTAVRLVSLSRTQFDKCFKAITGGYQGLPSALVDAEAIIKEGAVVLDLPTTARPKRPDLSRLKPGTSTHCEGRIPKDLRDLPYGRAAWSLATSCAAPENLMDDYPQADGFRRLCVDGGADETTTGHIAFIQENGAKARVVAVPNAWHQWLFQPLHDLLDNLAKGLSCSAVHDQNKGAWFIQDVLGSNGTLYCFDLSSATDRFPRVLQMHLLNYLGLGRYADALEQACQAWQFNAPPYYKGVVDYAVGQPMGLYGSFPLFHLTHCCLLAGAASALGLPSSSMSFMVLGDDVLIRDHKLAKTYLGLMRALGVDISDAKSICSSHVAEFAGFVGVATRQGVATYRPYKHAHREIVNNPVGLLNSLGCKLSRFPKWRKWVRVHERTRGWRYPDLSPLVPTDEAIGVNPRTISPERFANLLHLAELVSLDPESLDYAVPEFEYSEDWEDVVGELFDKQPTREAQSLKDFLRSTTERHGVLEDKMDDSSRKGRLENPPSSIKTDPLFRDFTECETPPAPSFEMEFEEMVDEDALQHPTVAEDTRVNSSSWDTSYSGCNNRVAKMHLD